jgi:tRNA-dihydrouridine synthase B
MEKIGNLELKNRLLLAPMLEPNDIAFRMLCKKAGCALTYTGMISPLSKKKYNLDDRPALQLFGGSAKGIKKFINKYDKDVSLWDFNLGCPSKLSKKLGHGAFLHKQQNMIVNIIKTIRESTEKPVTIKLRKSENALDIAKIVEKYVDAVAIHPRTISQGYSGEPDINFAIDFKKNLKVPVIYSGNVTEKNANELLKIFDFVFIGREAIGKPEIFSIINGYSSEIKFSEYLKLAENYKIPFRQIKYQAMNFTKGLKNAKDIRRKIIKAKNINDIKISGL